MIEASLIIKGAFAALLLLAAYSDARRFLIPNIYPAMIIFLFVVAKGAGFPFSEPLWSHLLHFAIALSVGLALFALRWFGGGDVKFYAAIALWFGLPQAILLLVVTAVSGAIIVLARMVVHFLRISFGSGQGKTRLFERRIAYGIAIAAGGIVSLLFYYP